MIPSPAERLGSFWSKIPFVTLVLVALSAMVYSLGESGWAHGVADNLLLRRCSGTVQAADLTCSASLDDLFRGELWRLFTPAFVHGNYAHFTFNTVYLLWFGSVVERVDRHKALLGLTVAVQLMVVGIEIAFNLSGTVQVGMGISGVMQGLGGYILARRWRDDAFALSTSRAAAIAALLMFLVGVVAPNLSWMVRTVHVGGFLVGAIVGALRLPRRTLAREAIADVSVA